MFFVLYMYYTSLNKASFLTYMFPCLLTYLLAYYVGLIKFILVHIDVDDKVIIIVLSYKRVLVDVVSGVL